jgi:hypothetical protein
VHRLVAHALLGALVLEPVVLQPALARPDRRSGSPPGDSASRSSCTAERARVTCSLVWLFTTRPSAAPN